MDKDDLKSKLEEVTKKMKDAAETFAIIGLESFDILDKKIDEAKSDLEATKENCRIMKEKGEGYISSKLIETQMNLEEAKKKFEEKKAEYEKNKSKNKYESEYEYAQMCSELSILYAEEATLSYLEAAKLKANHEKEYENKSEESTDSENK